MKKVCCFCESWESGGIESFLNNVLQHMDLTELQVDIVSTYLGESVFAAGLEGKGVRFIELSGTLRSIRNFGLFRKLLRENRYDVVHFNLFQGLALYYVQIAKEEGIPVRIVHSHNTALRKSALRPLKLLLHHISSALFSGSATDFWACSEAAGKFLFATKKRVRFIPNGIETTRFYFDVAERDAVRAEMGLTDAFVIGNVGRLCYQKNQDFLLDVFAEVLKERPESRLLLVGAGNLQGQLEEKAMQMGIADRVIFYGVTDRTERLYWAMDVLVMPSRFEGLPVTSVEAQAAGLPCVFSEAITRECDLTGAVFLPLDAGWSAWADVVKTQYAGERRSASELVRQAGFDTKAVAQLVETYYLGCGRA